jgi:hypothetical protein
MICTVCDCALPADAFRKHHDGSRMSYCGECHLAKRRAIHARTKDGMNAARRARYAEDQEYRQKYVATRKAKYARDGCAALAAWAAANPDAVKASNRAKMARYRVKMTDAYIARLLVQHGGPLLSGDIPQPMIEAKRLQLQIERAINAKHE